MLERSKVTSGNWLDAPFNRLGFIRVRELARTERISRGDGPVLELPRDERSLDSLSFEFEGDEISFAQMLESTFTDGLLVLHRGAVIFEHYANEMNPSDTHLLMSVSKSLTSTLCGVLVERGLIEPGQKLFDTRRRYVARVRADGTLSIGQRRGSIHKIGAEVQDAPACNGWQFRNLDVEGKLVPIDLLHQQVHAEMGRGETQDAAP